MAVPASRRPRTQPEMIPVSTRQREKLEYRFLEGTYYG